MKKRRAASFSLSIISTPKRVFRFNERANRIKISVALTKTCVKFSTWPNKKNKAALNSNRDDFSFIFNLPAIRASCYPAHLSCVQGLLFSIITRLGVIFIRNFSKPIIAAEVIEWYARARLFAQITRGRRF